jgi:hypothetical protein
MKGVLSVMLLVLVVSALPVGTHADRKTVGMDTQVRAIDLAKTVPGQLNYQGHLTDASDSSMVTATLEMTFRLFDAETKGAELWSETHTMVAVSEGLFQVLLGSQTAFPAELFDGSPLWLQTEVGTEVLVPRKPLVSVAFSQRSEEADHAAQAVSAEDAQQLDGHTLTDLDARWVNTEDLYHLQASDGDPADAVYVDSDGKVGVGTTIPLTELDVNGSVNAAAYFGDGSNLTGIAGTPDDDWTVSGDDVYRETGNVGIGTTSPTRSLDVNGAVNAATYYGDGSNLTGISGTTDNDWTISGDDVYHETGNVGIGTTSPAIRLDVDGEINSDSLYKLRGETILAAEGLGNLHIGAGAGRNNTGNWNLAIGDSAGYHNQSGMNTFIGYEAGYQNTTGFDNTFLGFRAGQENMGGIGNTFLGYQTGQKNTSGSENTFVGREAGNYNTTGSHNTFLGQQAGYENTDGQWNTFLGYSAGYYNADGDSNVFVGGSAGENNESGSRNTFLGQESGWDNRTGHSNTFLGFSAGRQNRTGGSNTFVGKNSGYSTFDGIWNTFLGAESGNSNTAGNRNTFLGAGAGWDNTTGNDNTFIGYDAGLANTTASNNTFVGRSAGEDNTSGERLTFLGAYAGNSNSAGSNNSFLGHHSGYFNTTGYSNTFVGNCAGRANIGGYANTFLGDSTGYANTEGFFNTFVGTMAGKANTTSDFNTFLGTIAGFSNSAGTKNTFVGQGAGYSTTNGYENAFFGQLTGLANTAGSCNTFLGKSAGYNNAVGDSNVFVGYRAGYTETSSAKLYIDNSQTTSPLIWGDFRENEVVVNGNGGDNTNDRKLFVNGSAGGTGAWQNDSDRHMKKSIATIPWALKKVQRLRGVNFEWKDAERHEPGRQMGFIAQEAVEVIPEVVDGEEGHYAMSYGPITALLVEAIKEQQAQIETFKVENERLKQRVEALESAVR